MTLGPMTFGPTDWDGVRLVVFDVDGTLYRQRPLRLRMARDLALHALTRLDLRTLAVLQRFRHLREELGEARVEGFAERLVAETAAAKLAALELAVVFFVFVVVLVFGVLKPHPKGLAALIARAGATPAETLMIGDRAERDGLVAQQVGARALLRSSRPIAGWQTFVRFDDPLFAPMLA